MYTVLLIVIVGVTASRSYLCIYKCKPCRCDISLSFADHNVMIALRCIIIILIPGLIAERLDTFQDENPTTRLLKIQGSFSFPRNDAAATQKCTLSVCSSREILRRMGTK
ncbi:hypothetical protein BDN70DRAFT_33794 [Pholiota conissans]|uniref:Uncharacterized protein n=1 Tax=Pholiota conissans TaxID=109636 RepID=A0A9P5Z0U1_9AGAR|nr:hypothetical protein BDN70DRAFT_33794 [Pholiota conissans]